MTDRTWNAPDRLTRDVPGIPVLRPRLPSAERLLPYLRRIDSSRVYSNWGPLVAEFEGRLEERLRLPGGGLTSASSGTAAIMGAVLATGGRARPERPLAVVPALTFVATAAAVERCGYELHIIDVDPRTWMLDPQRLIEDEVLDRVGVVIPVAPFGRAVPQAPWRTFTARTRIAVVIDGAAAFDSVCAEPTAFLGEVPVAFSFHATKSFSTGEGGAIASTDTDLALRCARSLNFGFLGTRESHGASINGKMSEYHAAVGLAELDEWGHKHAALEALAQRYRDVLAPVGLSDRLLGWPDLSASYTLFRAADAYEAERVVSRLRESGVDSRFWYSRGLHHHPHLADAGRGPLDVVDSLAPCLIGLPVAPDLPDVHLARIAEALSRGVAA